jgi:hypothetical protein
MALGLSSHSQAESNGRVLHSYNGEIRGNRLESPVPLELIVRFRDHEPRLDVRNIHLGRLTLPCDSGTVTHKASLRVAGGFSITDPSGRFRYGSNYLEPGDNPIARSDRIGGRVFKHVARGALRVRVFNDPDHGDCSAGFLRWKAERGGRPRSAIRLRR